MSERKPGRVVPSWDEYLMSMAVAASARSRDPDTQVGCVIADPTHHIVATGCNGPPPGIDDDAIDWSRREDRGDDFDVVWTPDKYDIVLHAEQNALLHATRSDLSDCTLYVTGRPCPVCMRLIAAKRIKRVVRSPLAIKMMDDVEWEKSLWIAKVCRISIEEVS